MSWENVLRTITIEDVLDIFEKYGTLGPVVGILLPMLEAFLPFLPLLLFVVANANAFGLWIGFLLSWLGASVGAILVFIIVRRLGNKRFFRFLRERKVIRKMTGWVERHGFTPLFLILCFPFTPSAAVNVVAGLSKISMWQFSLAVLSGKLVMIFVLSYIGQDVRSLLTQPQKAIIAGVVIFIMWIVGKQVEKRLGSKLSEPEQEIRGNER
ncbi:TVP38/TMEM64 family protein [Bacillus lacus]|uniref:TVP38/TMEM64 family membrane protein n=1 Tax=Metabacillus lacus TaxID=1983721 RepID=A0A7X2J164_9BACI|nr:TVP38/TMEM64 family protein [Metabacillus lacus]MRX73530.1 TVP38/TMEM64 family protein [Metabacillus lacus]